VVELTATLRTSSEEAPRFISGKQQGGLKTKKNKREEGDKTVRYIDQHLKTHIIWNKENSQEYFYQQGDLRLEGDGLGILLRHLVGSLLTPFQ